MADKKQIYKRIRKLKQYAKEEGEEINKKSLKGFYLFLRTMEPKKTPLISLTPDNEIYCTWDNKNGSYSMLFLSYGTGHFVVLKKQTPMLILKNRTIK